METMMYLYDLGIEQHSGASVIVFCINLFFLIYFLIIPPLSPSLPVSFCLCLFLSLPVSLSLHPFLSLSVCLCRCLSLTPSLSLLVCLSLRLCRCLFLSLSVSLRLSLSLSLAVCVQLRARGLARTSS